MKKIVFGITSLTLGGAERVLVDIVNKLQKEYIIEIFTIYSNGVLEKELNENIKVKSIYDTSYNELSKINKIIISIKMLLFKKSIYRKYINNNYDIEVAFLEGAISRLFSVSNNKKIKKIAWIHNDISKVFGDGIKAKIKKQIDKNMYNKYDKLIFVSKDNLENFNKIYTGRNGIISTKKEVIYNYIDKEKILDKAEEKIESNFDSKYINFLTVARLVEQKGIDRIINVIVKLKKDGINCRFYIIGDGPQKEMLEKLIEKYKVKDMVIMLGSKTNPYPYIKKADYFCLLSYFEGYGMVLEEAKVLNKNIIITDTAAREALEGYKKGQIVDNSEESIYIKIKEIINQNIKPDIDKKDSVEYENQNLIQRIKDLLEE